MVTLAVQLDVVVTLLSLNLRVVFRLSVPAFWFKIKRLESCRRLQSNSTKRRRERTLRTLEKGLEMQVLLANLPACLLQASCKDATDLVPSAQA